MNGNIPQKKTLGGGLRNFRMDKEDANKGQATLLRYFRSEVKKTHGNEKPAGASDQDSISDSTNKAECSPRPVLKSHIPSTKSIDDNTSDSTQKLQTCNSSTITTTVINKPSTTVSFRHSNTSPVTTAEEADVSEDETLTSKLDRKNNSKGDRKETSPVLQRRFRRDMGKLDDKASSKSSAVPSTSISQMTRIVQKPSSIVSHRTLSKPLFVDAPSPEPKEEEDGSNNEGDNDESSTDNPLGGISMKTLISKTTVPKKGVNYSEAEGDSQDSHIVQMKVIKRVRLVASSDEDDDATPPAKKQQLNGHNSSSDDFSDMPDDDTIQKFILMWESVYPFVEKMEFLDMYRDNKWDAKQTMTELGKLNKERKNQKKHQKIEEEIARKKEAAEKKEEKRKLKLAEKELESLARAAMKEKLKARKDAWKVKATMKHDEQDLEEDEEDYQFGGAKVYDSEEDSGGEESTANTGDRQLVLQFFNEASIGELSAVGGCSKKKAEVISQIRPFKDWTDIVYKFQTGKYVGPELLNEAKTILHVRNTVQRLMKRCENIAKEMQTIVSRIVSGEEDAGISKQPESLNPLMQLKGYQLIGLNWLVLMHEQGLNGVLADEMGLGKTVQAISFLSHIKEVEDPEELSLIIVPSSTLDNWARELELWCPSLEVLQYHGSQDERRAIRCGIMNNNLEEDPDVILTTYNMVTVSPEDKALFKKLRYHTVILDEAHMLKNMASQRYENLMKIKAKRRVLLTGTPLQNNLVELMSILIFVMPQLFDSKKEELKRVFSMFPKSEGNGNKGRFERERIEQAKRIMKPFFLRRLKCDVLKDLPPKHDEITFTPMSQRQKEIYSETVSFLSKRAQQHQLELEKLNFKDLTEVDELESTGGANKTREKTRDASSNMVTTLRKIANHPLLIRHHYDDIKLKKIAETLKRTTHRDSVLEYILEDFSVMSDFEIHSTCNIYHSIKKFRLPDELILSSGKFQQLDVLLPQLKNEGSRVLIFSQFVILLNVLEQYIKLRGHKYLRFDGTTQVTERQELIDQFTEDEDIFVFLLSTRAGGLGINMTAADTVIIHDIDFNPYNDKQAEDRCHRVGQTKPVKIIRLISKDTIEEGMLRIAQDKLQLERDITSLADDQQKKGDVVTLLKAALGIVKTDGQSNSASSNSDPSS
ncbi:SWI/SNF-related matrix-associated actin-dependent regulator of chromatin subfamily A containing DEAD/H box 1 homolog [Homarus americanus]|uniref:SWI/SNF-related matrix-associated actin-dependent regulator of chromatin subfamily A containing DEAD/H box 1 homolog n=1 Tax=Homarus americanus TaxID=6706 RepID=UPI001C471B72|nr:SWI/SNF-related matrix-associated actin-dependent regulator of chromatin subfamily A containing DEAD/H box 1 homolog [Homarus americanus]XP_042229697.1 SWI/SNF-related matrix-associated actin-dependent regulator of chromatin subfamily A containing DEAD/H box 1 homolog [Homarus americanus]